MKKWISCLLTLSLLLGALTVCPFGITAEEGSDVDSSVEPGWNEFPYVPFIEGVSVYRYKTMDVWTLDEAMAHRVPDGYSDHVMYLTGTAETGMTVDFSSFEIPIGLVKSLTIRVWYPKTAKEVRLTKDAARTWTLRHLAESPETWEDVVLDDASAIAALANKDGNLGAIGFGVRFFDYTSSGSCYLDHIRVDLVSADKVPPVITYDGPTELKTTAGKPLETPATAYDDYEKRAIPIVYEWPAGALDENGLPKPGSCTVLMTATDSFGNRAEIPLSVTVFDTDTEPPVIHCGITGIVSFAGVVPVLSFSATDNVDEVSVSLIWSDGALDENGRLTPGSHTLTLSSTDRTGNSSTHSITLTVSPSPLW